MKTVLTTMLTLLLSSNFAHAANAGTPASEPKFEIGHGKMLASDGAEALERWHARMKKLRSGSGTQSISDDTAKA